MSPFDATIREIRESRPTAPGELRERVRLVATAEPPPESRLTRAARALTLRRTLLVLTPATLLVALLSAGILGLTRAGTSEDETVAGGGAGVTADKGASLESTRSSAPPSAGGVDLNADAISPDPGRLQRIDAELSLRVDGVEELSGATQEAMRIVRGLGGHVGSVSYDATPGGAGFAQLALRVPAARVQSAVVQLSGLGTILGQRFGVQDLQETVDDLSRQIAEASERVRQLRRQLASTSVSDDERAALRIQLDDAQRQLAELRRLRDGTRAEGRFATIQLHLTTEDVLATPGSEEKGALDRAVDILRWEGVALLYAAVVLGPFLLLGLLVWLVLRTRRRRDEARLLAEN